MRNNIEDEVILVRMCLAEAGYPDAEVWLGTCGCGCCGDEIMVKISGATNEVAHKAYKTAGLISKCFECWESKAYPTVDWCEHEG